LGVITGRTDHSSPKEICLVDDHTVSEPRHRDLNVTDTAYRDKLCNVKVKQIVKLYA